MKKPYVIAEAGVNFYDTAAEHSNTPLEEAKLYCLEAKKSGIDAIKFQCYKADTIASKNSPAYWDMTKEPTDSQYKLFQKFDHFGEKEYQEICDYCNEIGIDFLATPFDYASADYLEGMVKVYKISSSDLSNFPLLRYIAKKGKPIFLSVGASYLSEVEEAVRVLKEAGCKDITLLHCVLSYPCKFEDANLNMIIRLKAVFPDLEIGYSDHTLPDTGMTVLTTAYLLGATVLEKHYTLNKTLQGNDHYHAGDPDDFKAAIENMARINTIIGNSDKTVLPCEEIPRKQARRSLVLTKDLHEGDIIQKEHLTAKRPGTGISPMNEELVVGRRLKVEVHKDDILTWDMI